jgi:hypothetical protein
MVPCCIERFHRKLLDRLRQQGKRMPCDDINSSTFQLLRQLTLFHLPVTVEIETSDVLQKVIDISCKLGRVKNAFKRISAFVNIVTASHLVACVRLDDLGREEEKCNCQNFPSIYFVSR